MRTKESGAADAAAAPPSGRFKVNFEDTDLGFDRYENVPDDYHGLRWHNFNAYSGTSATAGSGYETGLTSGKQGAFAPSLESHLA